MYMVSKINMKIGSERGLSVIREWPLFGSVTREKRKIRISLPWLNFNLSESLA
jgi:hypothetical protein